MTRDNNTHTCPRHGCGARVPNRLFACNLCWALLPIRVREAIRRTSAFSILHPTRRYYLNEAQSAWGKR